MPAWWLIAYEGNGDMLYIGKQCFLEIQNVYDIVYIIYIYIYIRNKYSVRDFLKCYIIFLYSLLVMEATVQINAIFNNNITDMLISSYFFNGYYQCLILKFKT